MGRSRRTKQLAREDALGGRPVKLELMAKQELPKDGLRLTVTLPRPGWHRWLGGKGNIGRSFELDALGCEVYEACDGKRDVKTMIADFAQTHNLSIAEAEMSVSKFLNMLMNRGLIGMDVGPQENGA